MAYSETIPEDQLNSVREQLAYFIKFLGVAPSESHHLAIGESFPIYLLPGNLSAEERQDEFLSLTLQETGVWHHQLKFNASPIGYAKSGPSLSHAGRWIIVRVLKSSLALDVDQAVKVLDEKRIANSIIARFVEMPAYKLRAFFLNRLPEPESEVMVIRSPFPELVKGVIYPEREFRRILLQIPPIVGVESD